MNIENLNKVKAFVKANGDKPISMSWFAERMGLSYKTVRNNHKLLRDMGVNFVRKNAIQTKIKLEGDLKESLFKAVNCYLETKGLPAAYQVKGPTLRTTRKQAEKVIKTILKDKKLSLGDKELTALHNTLTQMDQKLFNPVVTAKDKKDIEDIFTEMYGYLPTEEQVKTVFKSYVFFTRNKLRGLPGVIQADAGSSKTTCVKALQAFMTLRGHTTPPLITKTNKALEGIEEGQTFASYLNKRLGFGVNVAKLNSETVRTLGLVSSMRDEDKDEFLIVDEFSLLTTDEVVLLLMCAKKVLFVGDINQLGKSNIYPGAVISTLKTQYRFLNAETQHQVRISELIRSKKEEELVEYVNLYAEDTFSCFLNYSETSDGKITPFCDYSKSFGGFKDLLEKFKGFNCQVLAYSANAVHHLNVIMNEGEDIKEGSKVRLVKRDHKQVNAIPGTYWTVRTMVGPVCTLEDAKLRTIQANVSDLVLGYATTTWVSQGSEWDYVLGLMGTSDRDSYIKDMGTIATRSKKSLTMLYRADIDTEAKDIFKFLRSEEGDRYFLSSDSVTGMYRYMLTVKELPEADILKAIQYGVSKAGYSIELKGDNKLKLVKNKKKITRLVEPNYCLIEAKEDSLFVPKAENRNKTEEQVDRQMEVLSKKTSNTLFKAQSLEGSKYVVVDTDTPETTKAFNGLYGDKTEAWVSSDLSSGHFVFEVDFLVTSSIKSASKGVDLLGNATSNQLRFLKPNKVSNGLAPIKLTNEHLEVIETFTGPLITRPLDEE